MSQAINYSTSRIFQKDQILDYSISYFDTPFSPLENDVASSGLILDVRQPKPNGVAFTLRASVEGASASGAKAAFDDSGDTESASIVSDGRASNVMGYWSGGAPNYHGAEFRRQIAYHYRCYLKNNGDRDWWASGVTPAFSLAFAGNGYFRITQTKDGATTDVEDLDGNPINGDYSEADFLQNGLQFTEVITDLDDTGDYIDIYYIQDREAWGGFVVKAVAGSTQTQTTARDAPVMGCGIFDDDSPPSSITLQNINSIDIITNKNASTEVNIRIPLVNPNSNDYIGWVKTKASDDDPGQLELYTGTATPVIIKQKRLIRIRAGWQGEQYVVFTGFVEDIGDASNGVVTIKCKSVEQQALEQFTKNYPDRITYMAFGYNKREDTNDPVYDIPAFDNWPIEYVIRHLLVRAGVDESVLLQDLTVPKVDGTSVTVTFGSDTHRKLRARSLSGTFLKLDRAAHYGNYGTAHDNNKPDDDEYMFKPDISKEIWQTVKNITDKYGYKLIIDPFGHVVLHGANNPHSVIDFDAGFGGSPSLETNPDAYSGTYIEYTGSPSITGISVTAARIDLVIPRGVSHGSWDFTVRLGGPTVASGTIDPSLPAGSLDEFFYNFRTTTDGGNSTVVTLFSGDWATYTVDLVQTGGAATRRLDSFQLWHTDTDKPRFPVVFATDENAINVTSQNTMIDMRNLVNVIGRKKAAITDSTKLDSTINNPEPEYVVENAVDVDSITQPSAVNFVGYPKESAIIDSSITDNDFAAYVARAFIFRFRLPKPNAALEHTVLPTLQLFEPIYVSETKFDTIDSQSVVWVESMTHHIGGGKATTKIAAVSHKPVPAYEPREDIDIDAFFGGNVVANVKVSYTSLTNSSIVNASENMEYRSMDKDDFKEYNSVTVVGGSPNYLDMGTSKDWPPVVGTVQILQLSHTGNGAVTTLVNTSNPIASGNLPGGASVGNGFIQTGVLQLLSSITSVTLQVFAFNAVVGQYQLNRVIVLGQNQTTAEWWYTYNGNPLGTGGTILVQRNSNAGPGNPFVRFGVEVQWIEGIGLLTGGWFADNPYHHFTNVDYRNSNKRIYLPWVQGDSTTEYNRDTGQSIYAVRYRRMGPVDGSSNFLDPYGGVSPFYDPYTSEIGHLVDLTFDALVSGIYRISIRSIYDDTVVAWLTEPTEEPDEPEAHWSFVGAGSQKKLTWDGVDDVGNWNSIESNDYATAAHGAFEQDQRPVIGRGFYVWNRELDPSGVESPFALIAGDRDGNTGKPIFGQGTYAVWYIKFEATNDTLRTIAAANDELGGARDPKKAVPRQVNTTNSLGLSGLDPQYNNSAVHFSGTITSSGNNTLTDTGSGWTIDEWEGFQVDASSGSEIRHILSNTSDTLTISKDWGSNPSGSYTINSLSALVYTHLPEPTKVSLEIREYINATPYDETNPPTSDPGNWSSTLNTDALVNNDKPIRIRYAIEPRPGTLWSGNEGEASVKISRHSHLRVHLFDQFIVYDGVVYPDTATEKKTITNRRLTNDDHTMVETDTDWVKGKSFKTVTGGPGTQWVFKPEYFKKDFRGIPDESIQFMDYLQLEEVPSWDTFRRLAASRSRLQIAFMSYLFMLSVYTQDRSGRFVWGMNKKFIDPSKILKNAYADWWNPTSPTIAANSSTYENDWPVDMNTQHRRTIYCRQWLDEGTWRADRATQFGFSQTSTNIGWNLLRHKWSDHDNTSTTLNGNSWSGYSLTRDDHSHWHRDSGRTELPAAFASMNRQLGSNAVTHLNNWQWEAGPSWFPCITRDFHPYVMVPPMPEVDRFGANKTFIYLSVDYRDYDNSEDKNEGADQAAAKIWNSPVKDTTISYDSGGGGVKRFWPGRIVDNEVDPLKGDSNLVSDYLRQDDIQHYSDTRGMFSRDTRPAEGPIKVAPTGPYYTNPVKFSNLNTVLARNTSNIPLHTATVDNWFGFTFRQEYYWESASMFPASLHGREALTFMNITKAISSRLFRPHLATTGNIAYDAGAWVGWKDDKTVTGRADGAYSISSTEGIIAHSNKNVFTGLYMPIGVGPRLIKDPSVTITYDIIMHMVLVPERRGRLI